MQAILNPCARDEVAAHVVWEVPQHFDLILRRVVPTVLVELFLDEVQ